MNITVLYFASMADKAKKSQESLSLESADLGGLYTQLQDRYHFVHEPEQLRVAINDAFADWHDPLQEGDTVAFIPPVAGG